MKLTCDRWEAPCATYLINALFSHKKNLAKAKKNLSGVKFDTIVITGVSGLAFGIPLAQLMKKHIAICRKGEDGSHSAKAFEATVERKEFGRWIFVDDLVDTGKTKTRVKDKVEDHTDGTATYVGTYLYENHVFEKC